MKRYSERHYVWRTIWHDGNPAIISICGLVMACLYSPVISAYLLFYAETTYPCWYQRAIRRKSTAIFRQNYKASSKIAGTISTIVRLAVNRTAPSTLTRPGARPRVSSSGSKVSWRLAVSGQASGANKRDRHPKSGTNLHSQQQSGWWSRLLRSIGLNLQ